MNRIQFGIEATSKVTEVSLADSNETLHVEFGKIIESYFFYIGGGTSLRTETTLLIEVVVSALKLQPSPI